MARPPASLVPDPGAAHNRRLGRRGELLAARHLTGLGMVVLDRNWRCEAGEVDLVLRDGPALVICEVKTRTSTDYGAPVEAVDRRKADRLRRVGVRWLRAHDLHIEDVRVDVVGVLARPGFPVEIEHVAGVG